MTGHLNDLEAIGVIESAERRREGLAKGTPYRFYRLTDAARELFDRNDLSDEAAYRARFDEVERTDEIRAAEAADHPAFD